jgi:hypothetical protein
MLGNIAMTKNQEGKEKDLNKNDTHINRGFELLLRKRRRKSQKPRTFELRFGKMISLFKREIHLNLEFSLDIRKINSREK